MGAHGMWEPGEPNAYEYQPLDSAPRGTITCRSRGRTYVNFQTEDEDDARVKATYGTNYERLAVAEEDKIHPATCSAGNRNFPPPAASRGSRTARLYSNVASQALPT